MLCPFPTLLSILADFQNGTVHYLKITQIEREQLTTKLVQTFGESIKLGMDKTTAPIKFPAASLWEFLNGEWESADTQPALTRKALLEKDGEIRHLFEVRCNQSCATIEGQTLSNFKLRTKHGRNQSPILQPRPKFDQQVILQSEPALSFFCMDWGGMPPILGRTALAKGFGPHG